MMLRLLVLDAYDEAGRDALCGAGGALAGDLYRRLLRDLEPGAEVEVFPLGSNTDATTPALAGRHGIVWTGSNLTIHRATPEVRRHVEIARAALEAGIPSFGSCWGLHVAVTVGGGTCAAHPRGREFGIARGVRLEPAGRVHPMFAGKSARFDALTSHEDHAIALGPSTTLLAGNEHSPVQAVEVTLGRGSFWAVQYHPEYTLHDVACLGILRGPQLLRQGSFADQAALSAYLRDLEELHLDPSRPALRDHLDAGDDLLDPALRTLEVRNWLDHKVKPAAAG
ncbi:MAG: gamma-glutamyl-gamma-aminobutyrate hydrolase family protein [Deltaproteobacteria bacterium]